MSGCQGVWDWLLVLLIRDSGKNGSEDSHPFWVCSFYLYTPFVWVPVFGFLPNQDRRLLLCFHPSVCSCWPSWLWIWRGKLRCLSVQVFQKTLPKAQRTRGLSSGYKSNFLSQITSSQTNSISTKLKLKILTKPCAQSLNKSLALWTVLSYQICNKLLPIQSSWLTSAKVTINLNKFWVGIFTRQGHINQVY